MKKSPENAWRGNPYKRPGSPYWHYVFTDASGVVRRRSARTKDLRDQMRAHYQRVANTDPG